MNVFPPELRTASVVPRWSVVWTLTRDTVANHSYYVAMYADAIAGLLKWRNGQGIALYYLNRYALIHDLDETVTGDIVSPVKREILNQERADVYIQGKMQERLPAVIDELDMMHAQAFWPEIQAIVKAADRLDAVLFLVGEHRMGNGVIKDRIPGAMQNLEDSWQKLPCPPGGKYLIATTWRDVVLPAIRAHSDQGGNGV